MMQGARVRSVALGVAVLALGISSSAEATVGYGLATPNGLGQPFADCQTTTVPCQTSGHAGCGPPAGDCLQGFYSASDGPFTELRTALPLTYVRLFVPYDAVDEYNGLGCVHSYAWTSGAGRQDFARLIYNIQAAQADGLIPVVAFTSGTGGTGNPVPAFPDPGYGTSKSAPWAAWTRAGHDYSCGVAGIMSGVETSHVGANPVTRWESWNEPNGAVQTNSNGGGFNGSLGPSSQYPSGPCGAASYSGLVNDCGGQVDPGGSSYLCFTDNGDCGPTEASELWELAATVATKQFAKKGFTVAALSLSDAQNTVWLKGYATPIAASAQCSPGYYCSRVKPGTWAVHDFGDPSSGVSGAVGDISAFTTALASDAGTGLQVWITESAVDLNSAVTSDRNRAAAPYPSGLWPDCTNTEPDHLNASGTDFTFGACVDGQPTNQDNGAASFLALASAGNGEDITQVDWYEFQANNASTGWDSGLLSPPTGTFPSPDGSYSVPRASYCVLTGGAGCSATAADASDWSTNQDA